MACAASHGRSAHIEPHQLVLPGYEPVRFEPPAQNQILPPKKDDDKTVVAYPHVIAEDRVYTD